MFSRPRGAAIISIQKQLQQFPAHIKHHQTSLHMDTCRDASRMKYEYLPGTCNHRNLQDLHPMRQTCDSIAKIYNLANLCKLRFAFGMNLRARLDPIIRKLHHGPPQENVWSPLISWNSSEVTCLKDLETRKWMEIWNIMEMCAIPMHI